MEFKADIPEWAQDRNIFLIAGSECIAMKYAGSDEIYQKVSRCRYYDQEPCSMCCWVGGEECKHMHGGFCQKGDRPLRCCTDAPKEIKNSVPECQIRYEVR